MTVRLELLAALLGAIPASSEPDLQIVVDGNNTAVFDQESYFLDDVGEQTGRCSVASDGEVVTLSDGKHTRCMSLITPSEVPTPMPILFWFHGAGGSARRCRAPAEAKSAGFAYICGAALNGFWDIPRKITDATGTPCSTSDSTEVPYIKAALAYLEQFPELYDTSRVFTSGCSMGSAFSSYIANCLKQWEPEHISAFATLGSGLKIKGDGNRLPTNWGECEGCQYFPFAPVRFTDSLGLQACVFTNTGDGHFHKTDMQLAKRWSELGNPVETNVKPGGHCQNKNMPEMVKCLGIGTTLTTTTPNAATLTIRDVGGDGCLKSTGPHRLLEKRATSGCASFMVTGGQFRSMDIGGQCLDFFAGRGWGLWTCHGGDNQKLTQHGSKWCSGSNCVEESAPTSTPPPTTSTVTTTATATTTFPVSSASIRSGDIVFLKARAGNGKHIHVQGLEVQAIWESRGNLQAIQIEKKFDDTLYSGDVVYLKSHTGAHIDVEDGAVQARWTDRGSWQSMTIQKRIGDGAILADDIVCLRAHTGKNLDVEDSVVRARWEECGDWQALKIEKEAVGALFSGDSVHLLAHTGNIIEVEGSSVAARWTEMGVWQTFTIHNYGGRVIFSGDSVFVQAHTEKLLHVAGDAVVRADWSEWGEWQRFIIERKHGDGPLMPGDAVFLRAHTGNYIDVEGVTVQARFQERGLWQSLIVEKSPKRRLSQETQEEKHSEFSFVI